MIRRAKDVGSVSKTNDYVIVGMKPGAKANEAGQPGIEHLDARALQWRISAER